ncbi:MAG TPA: NUDIX domain-containing protein [Hyphomicrobiaceae bacterium]|nr:NUDIX domain-containing protein [Hyphomicrobiaceae bacterium]
MQHYVVGFLFNAACDRVVLMMKRRPAWQAGRWNGVGGRVEAGEDIHTAMHREAAEEIGVRPIWLYYVNLEYPEAHIAFFGSRSQPSFDQARQLTDERIYRHNMGAVLGGGLQALVPNLRFLIPMAVHALARENIVATTIPVYGEANAISEMRPMLKSDEAQRGLQ